MTTATTITGPVADPLTSTARSSTAQVARLLGTELRLFTRDTQSLIFVIGFPVITVLILGGVFGNGTDDSGFEFVNPQHFYTAAYFGVVLAGIGLIMLPVHVASYRERGIVRRFDTSGFPRWAFPATLFASGLVFAAIGFAAVLATAHLAFDLPPVDDWPRTVAGVVLGTLAFTSFGVALGSVLPTARAAQGIGLMAFFPMFLLAGGGPPPEALSDSMRAVADWLPLTHVIRSFQEPWLGIGDGSPHLAVVAAVFVASTAVWVARSAQVSRSA